VATCRLWTGGTTNISTSNKPPYQVIGDALRRRDRLTSRAQDKIKLCMPFVCSLDWALRCLPPEFDTSTDITVYRRCKWIYPNPVDHNPESHFPVGSIITCYDFRSSSESVMIASSADFTEYNWIYQTGADEPWLLADSLFGSDGINSLSVARDGLDFKGGGKMWHVVTSRNNSICVEDVNSCRRFQVQCTPNLATIFSIKTSKAKKISSLSHLPEEKEVLFPPLSQFRVTSVSRFFPVNPDQVNLEHVGTVEL
jgi:hypothetical protein